MQTYGDRLRFALKFRKVMQKKLAQEVGVSDNYIYLIAHDARKPSMEVEKKICDILWIEEEWLRTGFGSMERLDDEQKELAEYIFEHLTWEDRDLALRCAKSLASIPIDEWYIVENFIDSLALLREKDKKDGEKK